MANNKKFGEIGGTGLAESWGQIQDDFLREMRGIEAYKRFDEMRRNSPIVGSLLTAVEQSLRGISWQVSSDEGEDDERVEFLEAALDSMSHSWNDHLAEALTFLPFGFSLFEIVYRYGGDEEHSDDPEALRGKLTWRKFAPRGQDTVYRWAFDDSGGLAGFEQTAAPSYAPILIPIEKLILYRARAEKNNPEGRSILRTAWISYYYLKNLQQIEAIGIERDLAGLPMITMPSTATTDTASTSDRSVAEKIVRNVRNDEQAGVVIPDGWKFELVSTGGSRQFDTDKIITRYESRILMSALAQFLLLGQDRVGTQALSQDQSKFFANSINAVADIVGETMSKFVIPRLLKLNGMPTNGIRLEHSPAGDIDLGALGDFFQKVGDKITWLPADEVWLRGAAKLPDADPDDIEAEKEARRERQQAAFGQQSLFGKQPPAKPGEKPDDKLEAELFQADDDERPDESKRGYYERLWLRLQKKFFAAQKKRIMKGARELKKVG